MPNENDTESRRRNPPCDLHKQRLQELEKDYEGFKKTLYGEDGRGGVVHATTNMEHTVKSFDEQLVSFRKIFYAINLGLFTLLVSIAIKIFTKGA